jgi:hypothetical protein
MDEYGESRKRVHGLVERCEPRRNYLCLLVHEMKKSQRRGRGTKSELTTYCAAAAVSINVAVLM